MIENISEGEAKDLILKYCIDNNKGLISSNELRKELFPNDSIDLVNLLLEKIDNTYDRVADVRMNSRTKYISSNGITSVFLEQGGFTKSERDAAELKEKEAEKERIEFEKTTIDLRLKKWQVKTFWPIFIFAFIGFGFGVYNFINSLSTSKDTTEREERIEKMESELEKLRISISGQKSIDSLHTTKDSTDIGNK